ncbi:MAG: ornithine carbamoyltransferase [Magnetococcales bacterium]|nr:ornithine carbamoyltransferase [Magnetococcales bacterium]HIJ82584.1 ornithine carbamoyltransferase [Magnetococcales bacterium]
MTTTLNKKRDLLSLSDLDAVEIQLLFKRAAVLKQSLKEGHATRTLEGRTLGMLFEKPSTRTRVSFEVGMFQLGGHALFLSSKEIQLGRGETISDSARVLSRYLDALMIRTFAHENAVTLAQFATVPVINGLSDHFHPCQILADLFTYQEKRGMLEGRKVAFVGDGNNMAHSWILASIKVGCHLTLACPVNYDPDPRVLSLAQQQQARTGSGSVALTRNPREAVAGADLVITDTWISMGQEQERQRRLRAFHGFQVDQKLMREAKKDALFMHCLPAHREEEVTSEVLDGEHSVVWDEAENRLHVQKAILEWLILGRL